MRFSNKRGHTYPMLSLFLRIICFLAIAFFFQVVEEKKAQEAHCKTLRGSLQVRRCSHRQLRVFCRCSNVCCLCQEFAQHYKVVATFLDVNENSSEWNADVESNNTIIGKEVKSRIVRSALVNKTGNLVAVLSLSGFDLNRKSNAGDTVTIPFKDPNEGADGKIASNCAPCEEAYLFFALVQVRKEFRRLQTLHPNLHVLILISKFDRVTNVRIAQSVEEVDVIVETDKVSKAIDDHTTEVFNNVTGKKILIVNSMVNTNNTMGGVKNKETLEGP